MATSAAGQKVTVSSSASDIAPVTVAQPPANTPARGPVLLRPVSGVLAGTHSDGMDGAVATVPTTLPQAHGSSVSGVDHAAKAKKWGVKAVEDIADAVDPTNNFRRTEVARNADTDASRAKQAGRRILMGVFEVLDVVALPFFLARDFGKAAWHGTAAAFQKLDDKIEQLMPPKV